ncbi:MAG: TatD family nuclease-associated radical SAM protein [Eubacteriales bacterium]
MTSQIVTYLFGDSLYLNITNRCTNDCLFCIRHTSEGIGHYDLWLDHEPDLKETLSAAGDITRYREVVFCGYGEPLVRADLVLAAAWEFKKKGAAVRINTNGQANLIHGRNIAAGLKGLVDSVSISLNAADPKTYVEICRPQAGTEAYAAMLEFAGECRLYVPVVTLTAVEWPGVDMEKCRRITRDLGVGFRLRRFAGKIALQSRTGDADKKGK